MVMVNRVLTSLTIALAVAVGGPLASAAYGAAPRADTWQPVADLHANLDHHDDVGAQFATVTSADNAFVTWREDERAAYAWKPMGGGWTEPASFTIGDATTSFAVETSPTRVTLVWMADVSRHDHRLQVYTRWLDVDGSVGDTETVLAPGIAQSGYPVYFGASVTGAIAILVQNPGAPGGYNALSRLPNGEWTLRQVGLPEYPHLVKGVAVDDTGTITVIGTIEDPDYEIVSMSSPVTDGWTVDPIGPRPGAQLLVWSVGLAAAGPGGHTSVIWQEVDSDTGAISFVAATQASTGDAWVTHRLSAGCTGDSECGRVGLDADGNVTVMYVDPTAGHPKLVNVYLARYDASQQVWGTAQELLTRVPNALRSGVYNDNFLSVADAGDVVVIFAADIPGSSVARRTFRCGPAPADACAEAGILSGPPKRQAHVAAGPDGTATVAWTSWASVLPHVLARSLESTG